MNKWQNAFTDVSAALWLWYLMQTSRFLCFPDHLGRNVNAVWKSESCQTTLSWRADFVVGSTWRYTAGSRLTHWITQYNMSWTAAPVHFVRLLQIELTFSTMSGSQYLWHDSLSDSYTTSSILHLSHKIIKISQTVSAKLLWLNANEHLWLNALI